METQNQAVEDEVTETETAEQSEECQQTKPTHEAIAKLAYEMWEEAGCPEGTAESDWLTAEAILLQECDRANAEV